MSNKKKSNLSTTNKPKIIIVGGDCTIIINNSTYLHTVDELKEWKLFDSVVAGTITAQELDRALTKHRLKKSDTLIDKNTALVAQNNLEEKDGQYYRPPFPVSLPKQLVTAYSNKDITTDRIRALDWFWFWCNLNPDQKAARGTFNFLKVNGLLITHFGFILAYRNVNLKSEGNKVLHDFITEQYAKIKKQKAAPKNYLVVDNSKGSTTMYSLYNTKNKTQLSKDAKVIGTNLEDLYDNVSEHTGTVFTDAHTGTFEIKMGQLVTMNREDCDSSSATCSYGLHSTSYDGLRGGYAVGSHAIAILINPMDVVSVPGDYGGRKMRCCRYLPICTVTGPLHEGDEDVINFDAEMLSFSKEELKELGKKVKNTEDVSPIKLLQAKDVKKIQLEVPKALKKRRKKVTIR